MSMNVAAVGSYSSSLSSANRPVGLPTAANGGAGVTPYAYDQYQPAPGQLGTSSGLTIGRAAAWGGGIFSALKWLRPVFSSPSGWLTLGVGLAGWFVGEKVYKMLTGG
jgi:hypothetical protein